MEKKIRITINKNIADILEEDVKSFTITRNYLINYIFENLKDETIEDSPETKDNKVVIQFNLNKKNKEFYYDFLQERNIQVEANFIRRLIIKYALLSKHNRELFIFRDTVNRINYAIQNKKIVKIKFRDKRETTILPFHIGSSKLELSNYLFCYDYQEEIYKNYKLSNISSIYITKKTVEWTDLKFVEDIIKNFDPFLSAGKTVVAKLTSEGEYLLNTIVLNRPEIIKVKGDVYTFKCSPEQAKRYFSYFLDEIEILEPVSLRDWFITKFERAIEKYK